MQTGSRLDLQTQNYIDATYLCCNFCPSVSKQISSVTHQSCESFILFRIKTVGGGLA